MKKKITALTAAGALLITASVAWGHAAVKSYSPRASSTVPRSLSAVSVTFKSRVSQGRLTVTGPSGTVSRGTGSLTSGGKVLRVPLRSGLKPGRYRASWRSLATDGHVQKSSWTFRVR